MIARNSVNSADNVYYICGEVTFARKRKAITAIVKKAFHLYFGCKIGDQDKFWASHICCRKCATYLSQLLNGKRCAMPFAVLMGWREPSNHTTDCYFCMWSLLRDVVREGLSRYSCSRKPHIACLHCDSTAYGCARRSKEPSAYFFLLFHRAFPFTLFYLYQCMHLFLSYTRIT